ncbi:glutathione S-transferase [Striga asiatica]|uniref:Glutathione S-transferase n=1 Tax=Striga asiatica TaxID=4170 RepID=A0A5A7RG32_STRAF|nr:glutathione S-transferase [Striga asiatica]
MIGRQFLEPNEGENQKKGVKLAIEALEKIEEELNGKIFFGGDTIGFLDLIMGFVSYALPVWEDIASVKILDPVKFPGITAWMGNFINHPVIKGDYLPPRDAIFSYFLRRRQQLIPVYASIDVDAVLSKRGI